MSAVKRPLRWRKPARERGAGQPKGADLVYCGEVVMRVRQHDNGWYFYGLSRNSLDIGIIGTLDDAKAEAVEHARWEIKRRGDS